MSAETEAPMAAEPTNPTPLPRIVVLDGLPASAAKPGQTAPEGEPSWDSLCELGEVVFYDRTSPSELVSRMEGAAIALTNKVCFTADVIAQLPSLRYIGVTATGVNVVDVPAATAAGITVTNVPGYSSPSVAQHVFAMLLDLTNRVSLHSQSVHDGAWSKCPDFSYTLSPLQELAGKTILIVGMGSIGQKVAAIAHAFGMNVSAALQSSTERVNDLPEVARLNVLWGDIDSLLPEADVVSLNCPLTETTKGLINADRLTSMKKTALLLNTGRGPLIDESALAAALREGGIAGAGLDVMCQEPPQADNPLLSCPTCVITPHVAWASQEARARLVSVVIANVAAFVKGESLNVINKE
ncbi:hypothetical protein KIPB_007199 [Kipferlia bialata]|uniref:Glycerate dehydrogenase n=1 Tax=Kipferlia bialata TaxID=797122 RepID=A0A9K3CZY9_9EUKA|nr:hypothetical protein KIPB_007199 [Kipferlia bialata]|eukprot:g7199.t1